MKSNKSGSSDGGFALVGLDSSVKEKIQKVIKEARKDGILTIKRIDFLLSKPGKKEAWHVTICQSNKRDFKELLYILKMTARKFKISFWYNHWNDWRLKYITPRCHLKTRCKK